MAWLRNAAAGMRQQGQAQQEQAQQQQAQQQQQQDLLMRLLQANSESGAPFML